MTTKAPDQSLRTSQISCILTETGLLSVWWSSGSEGRGNERNVFFEVDDTDTRGGCDGLWARGKGGTTIDKEKEEKTAVSKENEEADGGWMGRGRGNWVSSTIGDIETEPELKSGNVE